MLVCNVAKQHLQPNNELFGPETCDRDTCRNSYWQGLFISGSENTCKAFLLEQLIWLMTSDTSTACILRLNASLNINR